MCFATLQNVAMSLHVLSAIYYNLKHICVRGRTKLKSLYTITMIGGTMMAAYLCVPMPTSPQSPTTMRNSCKNLKTSCSVNKAKITMPPFNPKDLFLSKLAIVVASSPKMLLNTPKISDTPPYLDFFDSPKLMALPLK